MTNITNCLGVAVTPGEPLEDWQKTGLELVARLYGGRDVVLAKDLTNSVDFDDQGRTRLSQIVQDSLHSGDSVYVVPFAAQVNPENLKVNPFDSSLLFQGKTEDLEQLRQVIISRSSPHFQNTDIENAELFVYRGLAQLNQCRLTQNQPIKPQSVVWITDAELFSKQPWKETPFNSPFRLANSPESKERQGWLNAIPLQKRSQTITTNNNKRYELTIVDIPPTVQEFCTPAPGGQETCLVNAYLFKQLWLPTLIVGLVILGGIIGGVLWLKHFSSLRKTWKLKVSYESDNREEQTCFLRNKQKITIGEDIYCPGIDIRGYLKRQGNQLYLDPIKTEPIHYQGRELKQSEKISSPYLRLNCPYNSQNFEITIKINK